MLDQDYTYQFGDEGWPLNDERPIPFVDVQSITGMDMPPMRVTERTRPGADGGYVDAEFTELRTVVIDATVYAEPTRVEVFMDALKENFAPSKYDQPFYIRNTEFERVLYCKCVGFKYDLTQVTRLGIVPIQIQLKAADPAFYGDQVSLFLNMADAGVELGIGRGYPRQYPLHFGGQITPTTLRINNQGNMETGGIIRIHGPVRNPVIYQRNDPNSLPQHDRNPNPEGGYHLIMTIEQGEWVDINSANRTVLLNSTANRRGRLTTTSKWFKFRRGNTILQFSGERTSSTVAPVAEVFFRPAWR
jgi:hypothetical protein